MVLLTWLGLVVGLGRDDYGGSVGHPSIHRNSELFGRVTALLTSCFHSCGCSVQWGGPAVRQHPGFRTDCEQLGVVVFGPLGWHRCSCEYDDHHYDVCRIFTPNCADFTALLGTATTYTHASTCTSAPGAGTQRKRNCPTRCPATSGRKRPGRLTRIGTGRKYVGI